MRLKKFYKVAPCFIIARFKNTPKKILYKYLQLCYRRQLSRHWRYNYDMYTRKNAQVATDLQTSCNKSVHKLLTRCIRTACSEFVRTSLEQAVDKL